MKQAILDLPKFYIPSYIRLLVIQFKKSKYDAGIYTKWYFGNRIFSTSQKTHQKLLKRDKLLLGLLSATALTEIILGALLIYMELQHNVSGALIFGIVFIIATPIVLATFVPIYYFVISFFLPSR